MKRCVCQKFPADPKTNRSGHVCSFQLAITRAQTNLHCHAYARALVVISCCSMDAVERSFLPRILLKEVKGALDYIENFLVCAHND